MVLNFNAFSVTTFLLIIAGVFLLRWGLVSFYRKSTKDLVNVVKMLSEKGHQQQVIYNISTSIFLLRSTEEIIRSTISEIVIMYHWSNVAYFPKENSLPKEVYFPYGSSVLRKDFYGQPPKYSAEEIFQAVGQKGEANINSNRLGEYASVFSVGRRSNPLGVLYVGKTGSTLTEDQTAFFKTIASFLTVALENIESFKS